MLLTANIFQPLIDVFEAVLKFFHNTGGISWGWSIVLLTVCMRLILVPLMVKQFHSMQALQRLQPEMKALQSKYKDDKQRQQQELMKFYKENNVNPLGSCLPMVLQLPVFISLYYMLRQSLRDDICHHKQLLFQAHYALHHPHVPASTVKGMTVACGTGPHSHAGFLFIGDLTNKATGATLVALIILYVGTQLASSLLMAQPTMDQTQRRLMLVLPVFFVIFIIQFPAGLLVYWITTNAWTMAQQFVLRRRVGARTVPAVSGAVASLANRGEGGARGRGGAGGKGGGAGGQGDSDGGGREGGDAAAEEVRADGRPTLTGGGLGGGLGALLRGRTKAADVEASASSRPARARTAAPPPSPRKKKKRSGRRR